MIDMIKTLISKDCMVTCQVTRFGMLICGNSGSGKTNLLYHMLMKPLLYYDRIHLYAKNLEQQKYKDMLQTLTDISNSVGYNVLVCSNDDIIPVEELKDEDAQKIVIFDDFHL